ncbi:MAG: PEP-CTERM sorting domain-containing protein [Bryobacteraceae bacterium]
MPHKRIIGIIFAAMTIAILLQIPMYRSGLKKWKMAPKPEPIPVEVRALRPVYPYSVIPGGVYSREELGRAVIKDQLVGDHYADFNVAAARLVTTDEVRYAYVSYRVGQRVLWTTHKLRIPKGETLLTDGVNYCRTRCGNRLSDVPHRQAAANEPIRLLSLPNFTPTLFANNFLSLGPALVETGTPIAPAAPARLAPVTPTITAANELPLPPQQWLPVTLIATPGPVLYAPPLKGFIPSGPNTIGGVPSPISAIPEPQTLALISVGLFATLALFTCRRKKSLRAGENPPQR